MYKMFPQVVLFRFPDACKVIMLTQFIQSVMPFSTSYRFLWEGRGVYRVLVGKSEGKKPLGRPRRRWEDNIKMDLREIGIDGANWIQLAQDRVQWRTCEHGNVPSGSIRK
jgi:hypothetical protein